MSPVRTVGTLLAAMTLCCSCGAPVQRGTPSTMAIRVEIDVYSGRPNPSFNLSEASEAELVRKLRDLPHLESIPPEPGLGYRGYIVTATHRVPGFPSSVRIGNGIVVFEGNAYRDVHSAEDWLRQLSIQAGHGALLQQLRPD